MIGIQILLLIVLLHLSVLSYQLLIGYKDCWWFYVGLAISMASGASIGYTFWGGAGAIILSIIFTISIPGLLLLLILAVILAARYWALVLFVLFMITGVVCLIIFNKG